MISTRVLLLLFFLSGINAQIALPTFQAVHKPHTAEASSSYDFTSQTFTNCSATGKSGPTLSDCTGDANYSDSWTDDTDYFNITQQGYQLWTVPQNGDYTIEVWGASEGWSGHGTGAHLISTFTLTEGDKYMILCGQKGTKGNGNGNWYASGGGGGTFVVKGNTYNDISSNDALIVAGGGGGSNASSNTVGQSGQDGLSSSSSDTTGGGSESGSNGGGGWAGLTGNGDGNGNTDALSFKNGGTGGTGHQTYGQANGGFGGGGPGGGNPGGGGGGMSGGDYGRDGYNPNNLSVGYNLGGKGGGSYTSGNNTTFSTSDWDNHGKVVITKQ